MMQLPDGHSTPAKRGVNFVVVGRSDPSNSDSQNGDGGGLVCACARASMCALVCVCACVHVFAMYYNNILPRLIMILIKIILRYLIEIAHTDHFPSAGTRLVRNK